MKEVITPARPIGEPDDLGLAEKLIEIGRRLLLSPILDDRSPEEIIGYDERGLPR